MSNGAAKHGGRGTETADELYAQKKWRMLGEILREGEMKHANAWLAIHRSSKEDLLTYESKGLVVAVNGSGSLASSHPQCQEAAALAAEIVRRGGIILNGGRNSGIMAASSRAAGERCVGVIFPELAPEANRHGTKVIVNAPTPRIELLSVCAPVIVMFRGGLGTLMALLRAIVHLRNRQYHHGLPPQLVFVSSYWIGLLTTMRNLGCLPREFVLALRFFDRAEQILEKLPPIATKSDRSR